MTNSPVSSMRWWENLSFLTDIYVIGGSELTMPVHATVNTLLLPCPDVTMTTGTGFNIAPFPKLFLAIISFPS